MKLLRKSFRNPVALLICASISSSIFAMKDDHKIYYPKTEGILSYIKDKELIPTLKFAETYVVPYLEAYIRDDFDMQKESLNTLDTYINLLSLDEANLAFRELACFMTGLVKNNDYKEMRSIYDNIQSHYNGFLNRNLHYAGLIEIAPHSHGFLEIALLFSAAEVYSKDFDKKLKCVSFINKMPKYLNGTKRSVLLGKNYLKYVLPFLPFFAKEKISALDLSNREINILPVEILQLPDLEELNLSGNNFTMWTHVFDELHSKLSLLSIGNNPWKELPHFDRQKMIIKGRIVEF